MTKTILTVGNELPGGVAQYVALDSEQSLSDADIIIFEPGLALETFSAESSYEGKPSLYESASFQAKERVQHWKRELETAFNAGKLIVVLMVKPEEVFIKTGKKSFEGTGRNARVTNYVEPLSSYAALPFDLRNVVAATGSKITAAGDLRYLAVLWKEFGGHFRFQTYFAGPLTDVFFRTPSDDRIVGGAIRKGKGAALFLPPLDFDRDKLVETDADGKNPRWTERATEIGHRLRQCIVEIAKAIATESRVTPPPGWVADGRYRLKLEEAVEKAIALKSAEIERLHAEREILRGNLQGAGSLRRLLFEKGRQLEDAILESLLLMGFKAERYKDSESEFDAVFTSEEGRFLGEAEGKDGHAINIDKLSQLERNIQEDFARPEVDAHAKGVLFGNAYRLTKPEDRGDPFTAKCRTGAARSRTALVPTPALFAVAKYLKEHANPEFAKRCRLALLSAEGKVVEFPNPPVEESSEVPSQVALGSGDAGQPADESGGPAAGTS
jgi:hypothetical protein